MIPKANIKQILDFMFKGRDSVFIIILGFNQSGKTDLMFWFTEQLYEYDYFKFFGLNQHVENQPYEYDFIRDLETLLKRCTLLKKPYFYFLDELAQSANRSTSWEKTNLGLIKALEVRRKYKLSIGGAGIGEIDRRILSPLHIVVVIQKRSLTTAVIHHVQKEKDLWIYDIPKTNIKFKEYDPAVFLPTCELSPDMVQDLDVRIALEWAQHGKYGGSLSKPAYYAQIKRGIAKLSELAKLSS